MMKDLRSAQILAIAGGLLLLIALPAAIPGNAVLTVVCQMEIAALFALSYNMLLGETGLFSFGHAVFMGLGGFVAIHALKLIAARHLPIPIVVLPVAGALGGLFFGVIFGWLATRRSGTAFIMITLGFSELVNASAFVLTDFFGGEEGINADRTDAAPFLGWDFGPQIEVYYLTAFWTIAGIAAIFALRKTPLGRLANATRDRRERVSFVGYDPSWVCFLMFCLSATVAGFAGGLYAINYEIMTAASLGYRASSMVIVMVYIGGVRHFAGPIVGAFLITLAQANLANYTGAWLLYLGLLFVLVIVFVPEGLAPFLARHVPVLRAGLAHRLLSAYAAVGVAAALLTAGAIAAIEMTWRLSIDSDKGPHLRLVGIPVDVSQPWAWAWALALAAAGLAGLRLAAPWAAARWKSVLTLAERRLA
jgi:branched-chain amino acid transport system permease protein